MSSSRGLSQAQLLTERDVSKIIVSRPASSRDSTSPSSKKSRVSHDITPTVGVSSTSLLPQPQTKDQSVRQNETTVTDAVVKEEPYEYYIAPSIIKPGYDADNDVEIIEVLGVGSSSISQSNLTTSKKKQGYPCSCSKCKRVLGNKGALSQHNACQRTKHFTCLRCQVTYANRSILIKHQENCNGSGDPAPFQCSKCSKKFTRKNTFNVHLRKFCSSLKKSNDAEMDDIEVDKEDDPRSHQDDDQNDDNEEGDDLVADHEDLEDTRGDHVSCKECRGRLFTREKFENHQQLTGHTGDTIRLPQNVIFY